MNNFIWAKLYTVSYDFESCFLIEILHSFNKFVLFFKRGGKGGFSMLPSENQMVVKFCFNISDAICFYVKLYAVI